MKKKIACLAPALIAASAFAEGTVTLPTVTDHSVSDYLTALVGQLSTPLGTALGIGFALFGLVLIVRKVKSLAR